MPYYVYIIKSLHDGTYYKGVSEDYTRRLAQHNEGRARYTSSRRPWILIYAELHPDKKSALIRERKLKKCNPEYFEWLTHQPSNLLGHK